MNLFVDDIRNPPNSDWLIARSYDEAITILDTGLISAISLDHDLGEGKTGYDVICWIEKKIRTNEWVYLPEIYIHTSNPVGRQNMQRAYDSLLNYFCSL